MKQILLFFLCPLFLISQTQIAGDINGVASSNFYGWDVSVSSDGSIIAIGATGYSSFAGYVQVFHNPSGTAWEQIGSDIVGEASGDQSGTSVRLSSDGSVIVIGAPINSSYYGHARVYKNNGGTWEQLGSDIDGINADGYFGQSVSISSDGTIVAIAAPYYSSQTGLVRVFEYNEMSDSWLQLGSDLVGENTLDRFGYSTSLSSDGTILAISSSTYSSGRGNVKVYEYSGSSWSQKGSAIIGDLSNDSFGYSVSISADGNILAIGAPGKNGVNGTDTGQVKVYGYSGDWSQIGIDQEGDAQNDSFGINVSLSGDGNILLVGTSNSSSIGYARVFKNNGGTWSQIGTDINGEFSGDGFGQSLSLSSDATTAIIGSPSNDEIASNAGQSDVYDLSAILSSDDFVLSQFSLFPNPAKDQFTISFNKSIALDHVNIYNQLGHLICSTQKTTVSTLGLSTGMYYVEVISNQGKATNKLIVE